MKELLHLIIGSEPFAKQVAFIFFTLLGMILVKLWRYDLQKEIQASLIPSIVLKFDFKYWLNDNLLDFITAFVSAFVVHRFLGDVLIAVNHFLGVKTAFKDDMFYGLLLGLSFQYVIHKILNKFKIIP